MFGSSEISSSHVSSLEESRNEVHAYPENKNLYQAELRRLKIDNLVEAEQYLAIMDVSKRRRPGNRETSLIYSIIN